MQASLTTATPRRAAPSDCISASTTDVAPSSDAHCAAALDSSALLQGHKTVAISHNGSVYRLQATKLGKLILTK